MPRREFKLSESTDCKSLFIYIEMHGALAESFRYKVNGGVLDSWQPVVPRLTAKGAGRGQRQG